MQINRLLWSRIKFTEELACHGKTLKVLIQVKFNVEEEKRKIIEKCSFPNANKLSFDNIVGDDSSRREAALKFFTILSLEAEKKITIQQDNFWGPIFVTKT